MRGKGALPGHIACYIVLIQLYSLTWQQIFRRYNNSLIGHSRVLGNTGKNTDDPAGNIQNICSSGTHIRIIHALKHVVKHFCRFLNSPFRIVPRGNSVSCALAKIRILQHHAVYIEDSGSFRVALIGLFKKNREFFNCLILRCLKTGSLC